MKPHAPATRRVPLGTPAAGLVEEAPFMSVWILRTAHERTVRATRSHISKPAPPQTDTRDRRTRRRGPPRPGRGGRHNDLRILAICAAHGEGGPRPPRPPRGRPLDANRRHGSDRRRPIAATMSASARPWRP